MSSQQRANEALDKKIATIFNHHKKRYGAPRITRVLKSHNEQCSHTHVARWMKQMGLVAVAKKKFKVTTDSAHHLPVYSNVRNRDFSTTSINQKWACDITYIRTQEGWLYLAVVIIRAQ
ncbi:IS3 family transposase [Legionella brunensis]|uniref:IS3 family transposase n=1 Tax=Legionella brunensis TaxID=29422 RepID=UPI0013EFB12F|nr:IS3 family transposase [Legionella brunensis]